MKPGVESSRADRGNAKTAHLWIAAALALLFAASAVVGIVKTSNMLAHDRKTESAATNLQTLVTGTHAAGLTGSGATPGSELAAAAALAQLDPAVSALEQASAADAKPVRAALDKVKTDLATNEQLILTGQSDPATVDQAMGQTNQTLIDAANAAQVTAHHNARVSKTSFALITGTILAIAGLLAAGLFATLARTRTAAARDRRERSLRYHSLMQNTGDVVALVDRDGQVVEQSASMLRLLGRSDATMKGHPFAEIVRDGDRQALSDLLQSATVNTGEPARARVQLSHVDGSWRAFDAVATTTTGPGEETLVLLTCRPAGVTVHTAQAQQPVEPVVQHPVSGLLTETFFRDRLQHALTRAMRSADPVSLLVVDFEPDERVTELSEDARAAVIRTISGRLIRTVRGGDSVGHLGELELGVILEESDRPAAVRIARRLHDSLQQPVAHLNGQISLMPRIGIASKEDPRDNADTLMLDARASLARGFALAEPERETPAVAAGTPAEQIVVDEPKELAATVASEPQTDELLPPAQPAVARREPAPVETVAPSIEGGFERDAVELHYLPALALESGEIVEMETIVRWKHPQRGWIPLASSGMGAEVLPWLLAHTCSLAKTLPPTRSGKRVRVSVNLTPDISVDDGLVDLVATTLLNSGVEPSNLQIEFPARMLDEDHPDFAGTIETLKQLRDLGIRLTLDGAGAEANRLPNFATIPVHGVKIDRSVVTLLDRTAERRALVRALVERAQPYGVRVCGTGVDSLEQAERMWDLGVDEGQGPLFFRPVTSLQLSNLFTSDSPQAAAD